MITDHTVVVDGITYNAGEEVPDLGKWERNADGDYIGYEADVPKLPHYRNSGVGALCLDTGTYYVFKKAEDKWVKLS